MSLARGTFSLTAIIVAAAVAVAGCGSSGKGQEEVASRPAANQEAASGSASASANESQNVASVSPTTIKLEVKADEEHAKKGPEGTWHDAYLPADFTVKAGQKVTVHVYNYDEGKHSFTDPGLGLDVTIAGGSEKAPKETTFTFTAPSRAGEYEWFCDFPCDPWAMQHKGYMRGDVTVS